MGLLDPYVGRYVSAESASNYIDARTIISGCNSAISEASYFNTIATKISTTTAVLDVKTLSVDNLTVQGNSDECCNNIISIQNNIIEICDSIITSAEAAYNRIQEQLNQEAYQKDQELILYYSNRGG